MIQGLPDAVEATECMVLTKSPFPLSFPPSPAVPEVRKRCFMFFANCVRRTVRCYNVVMFVVLHVGIAILGLVQASYGLIAPSRATLRTTYVLTAGTFASGTYLVWHLHANVLQSCMSGLTYLALIVAATAIARHRLGRLGTGK